MKIEKGGPRKFHGSLEKGPLTGVSEVFKMGSDEEVRWAIFR